MLILPYDTETTGLPNWKTPSEGADQPHIVELCALLYDDQTRELVDSFHTLIRPDGWAIPADMTAIHGITNERAMDEGMPEADAVAGFLALHARAGLRIAHNESFDARILRIAIKRYGAEATQDERDAAADRFREALSYCTCINARRSAKGRWPKAPTLQEAHQHFLGAPFEGAHGARADAEACARVYFAIQAHARAAA